MKSRKEVQSNLTIYKGFTREEINQRVRRNRAAFEKACQKQGVYLPSEDELSRWFKEDTVAASDEDTLVHGPPVATDQVADLREGGPQLVRRSEQDVPVLPEVSSQRDQTELTTSRGGATDE